nr:malonyl-CoA decarboxylase family protein [Azospirillum argentinense]
MTALPNSGESDGEGDPDERPVLAAALALPAWHAYDELQKQLRGPLMRLCAHYLTTARASDRRSERAGAAPARALDPVAHFHLSNGARMERLNWLGDRSAKGVRQSCGMMINYRYKLGEIDANHEAYRGEGKVNASSAIRSLGKGGG